MRTRIVVAVVALGTVVVGAAVVGYAVTHAGRRYEPEVRIRNEDYAAVRTQFRTRLAREAVTIAAQT